jgi:hypothetical protein
VRRVAPHYSKNENETPNNDSQHALNSRSPLVIDYTKTSNQEKTDIKHL